MQPKEKLLFKKNNIHMNFRFPGRPDTMMTRFEINDQIFTYDKLFEYIPENILKLFLIFQR